MAKKLFSLVAAFALLFTACDTAEVGEIHAEMDTINLEANMQCTFVKYVIDKAVEGAKVTAKVLGAHGGDKIKIVKFRRRKHSQKVTGHRQWYTDLQITGINQ